MTDKELEEWEEEAKETDQDIKYIGKVIITAVIIGCILFFLSGCGAMQMPCGHP